MFGSLDRFGICLIFFWASFIWALFLVELNRFNFLGVQMSFFCESGIFFASVKSVLGSVKPFFVVSLIFFDSVLLVLLNNFSCSELETFELWILGLMLDPLFFLNFRLNNACGLINRLGFRIALLKFFFRFNDFNDLFWLNLHVFWHT